jgi:hypothetical protein
MAQLTLVPFTTQGMSRLPKAGLLLGEASTMGIRPGHQWERLYDDACDVGLALTSHKTGVTTTWYLKDTVKDSEQEVLGWMFCPTPETARRHPELARYQLNIGND